MSGTLRDFLNVLNAPRKWLRASLQCFLQALSGGINKLSFNFSDKYGSPLLFPFWEDFIKRVLEHQLTF